MTTIAYKDGILAADTQLTFDDATRALCHKITTLPNGAVVSCAGHTSKEYWFIKWVGGEKIPKDKANFKGLEAILLEDGQAWWFIGGIEKQPIQEPFYALGSGGRLARGAMSIGMTAKQAVEFASRVDIYTNNKIDTYDTKRQKITYGK